MKLRINIALCFWLITGAAFAQQEHHQRFLSFFTADQSEISHLLKEVEQDWQPGDALMTLEVVHLLDNADANTKLLTILETKTGQKHGASLNAWYRWLWQQPETLPEHYDEFKAGLYRLIDPKFAGYFRGRLAGSLIRWDEIRWGGVKQDGIPPLHNPTMLVANDAAYLSNYDVVFGVELNGEFRAYPKRILAWHEMFTDEIGGVNVVGVYCTLCGSMIMYETNVNGVQHQMGTSGFLYRSNKLMFDHATQSLWSTMEGKPVVGALVGENIELPMRSVITTTWGEWKRQHPETTVLSQETGHQRDYREGVAYHDYFGTDELLFNTPHVDKRLKNKDEVVAIRNFEGTLAISAKFLKKNPIYRTKVGSTEIVVLTDKSGANRVYEAGDFKKYDRKKMLLVDHNGETWKVSESQLIGPNGQHLPRLAHHRAFWFGWKAAFPETVLIQ